MSGALMQLIAYGAQDLYLTGNPIITYFKVVYRRHTNFSVESIEQSFNISLNFGGSASVTLSRHGDLVNGVYFETTLPNIQESTGTTCGSETRWIDDVGHHLIDSVECEIGGNQIDKHYGDWLEIWAQLTVPAGKMVGYREMIGMDRLDSLGQLTGLQNNVVGSDSSRYRTGVTAAQATIPGRTIYVPLQFWFCRNSGASLPLIALQYHEVKLHFTLKRGDQCIIGYDNLVDTPSLKNTTLWVDYIYLDTDERRRFAQISHEYLIEQLQYGGPDIGVTTATANKNHRICLNFNHPVKELVWVVQYEKALNRNLNQWSNYTNSRAGPGSSESDMGVDFEDIGALSEFHPVTDTLTTTAGFGAATGSALASSSRVGDQLASSPNRSRTPLVSAKLQLNSVDRFATRNGTYFNWVQCFKHHTNIPDSPGIHVYSFALKPEDHQPSGSCNFSRIDRAYLDLTIMLGNHTDWGPVFDYQVRVYARNYNILRVCSGMAGIAYSN